MTSSARGIGLEICSTFLKRGCRLAALDKDPVTLDKTETQFNSPDFLAIHCDVSQPTQWPFRTALRPALSMAKPSRLTTSKA